MQSGADAPIAASALAGYLRHNPDASDTAEGIRRWWFSEPDAVTTEELEDALNCLQMQGLIEGAVAADGRLRYRRIGTDAQLDAFASAAATGKGA